jgi:drug/metabolite transporter (DMT)-like permease
LVFATKYAYFKKRTTGPGEALSTAAQIAVTLAGFAGVVVVFRRESVHEWSPIDILPLGLCVTAILLLTIEPTLTGVWRWCSGAAFVVFLAFAIVVNTNFRHLKLRPSQGTVANFIFYLFATLLQSYNVALLGAFWPFFAGD